MSKKTISLKNFVAKLFQDATLFEAAWKRRNKINSDEYRMDLEYNNWVKAFAKWALVELPNLRKEKES